MTPLGQILASLRRVCPDLFETGDEESESCEQTPSAFGIVHIGGGHVDGDGNAQRINQQVPLTALDVFMGIKAADPSGLLDGLDADAASMMAALGCGFLPCRSRSARCSARSKSVQVPLRRKRAIRDRRRFAMAENWLASSATGSRCAARRRSRRRWSAESGLAVCHVWMREADSVGDSSTLHQKGCLDTWYSFLQSIT